MRTFFRIALALTILTSTACDGDVGLRAPGPHSDEQGLVTYWLVTEALPLEYDQCTDAADWRGQIAAPEFSANSFLMYRVAADGSTALSQSCETTSASSCTDGDKTWNVSGNVLTATDDPTESAQSGYDCSLRFDTVWRVTDNGETGRLDVELNLSLVGDTASCQTLDSAIAAAGTNGVGFDGCRVTIPVDMTFRKAD